MPSNKTKPGSVNPPQKSAAKASPKRGPAARTPELQLGAGGKVHQTASTPETRLTTNHGVPVSDDQSTLSAGPRGPHTPQAQPLLDKAGVEPDAGVVQLEKAAKTFITPAGTRQWAREPNVRILA